MRKEVVSALRLPSFAQGIRLEAAEGHERAFEAGESNGFRHSDTIIVTEDGCEVLTKYPKTLPDLIFR